MIIQYSPGSLVGMEAQMIADIKIIIGVNTELCHRGCIQKRMVCLNIFFL